MSPSPRHADSPARVVVTGKGGAGKTTVAALLARVAARRGLRVVAVDGDAQRNLAHTLGVDAGAADSIRPLDRELEYVEEKTGVRPGSGGGMLRLTCDVADVLDRFGVDAPDGVRLLVMGDVETAGGGCLCPENSVLRAVVASIGTAECDLVVLDTAAGVEHFGRAVARGFDRVLTLTDATFNAVRVARLTALLARDLGVPRVEAVVNRSGGQRDITRVLEIVDAAGGFSFDALHAVREDPRVRRSEPSVQQLLDEGFGMVDDVVRIVERVAPMSVGGRVA